MKNRIIAVICFLFVIFLLNAQEVTTGPARGVTFSNDNVSIRLGGRVQARHTYDGESEHSNFSIPRIRLALRGSLYDNIKWEFQSDFAKKEATTLKDGLVEYTFSDAFNLRMGQFKVRFDRQNFESSGRQTFVDRAIAARSLGMGRDVGLLMHGNVADRKVQYSFGVFNGGGEGGANLPDRGHTLVGRVSINPLGNFGLSQGDIKPSDKHLVFVDLAIAQRPDVEESFDGTTSLVFGAGYRFSGIYIAGEYFTSTNSAEITSNAMYAQASYMIIPEKFELAGRYSMVDPNADVDDIQRSEIMGGFNYYFHNLGHSLKLTADIAVLEDQATEEDSYVRTRLQIQGVF